jgi:hypothetical protein
LKYELKTLQEFVLALAPEQLAAFDAGRRDLPLWKASVESESVRIKDSWTTAIFTAAKDNIIERYIQYHQTGIIEFADLLQSYHDILKGDNEESIPFRDVTVELIRWFISQLFELLNYIERFFSKYFNLESKIPETYRAISFQELSDIIKELQRQLSDMQVEILLQSSIHDFLNSIVLPQTMITFRKLIYLKEFLKELSSVFIQTERGDWDNQISMALLYLNYNHLGFFSYYQDLVNLELADADNNEQHIEILMRYLSIIKAAQLKPAFSYNPEWPTIKLMLETWLNDEIATRMLAGKKDFNGAGAKHSYKPEKLPLNISVAQLALIVRLFYESGHFAIANIKEILRFIALHYESKKQQHISTGSIHKEFYSVTQVTAAVVRDMLLKMVDIINKRYFPVIFVVCAIIGSHSII